MVYFFETEGLIGALASVSLLIFSVFLCFLLFCGAAISHFRLIDGTSGTTVHVSPACVRSEH